jgi:hypothetical protein
MKKTIFLMLALALLFPTGAAEAKKAMAQTRTIPEAEYAPGTYEFELNTLPGNSIGVEFILTRVPTNPEGLLATIEVFFRRSNSDPWVSLWGPNDFVGGSLFNKDGSLATTSSGGFTWPGEAGQDGKPVRLKGSDVKFRAVVFQTFRTAITINSISSTGK